ncbi:MAG: hypothetical protein DWQ01_09725 [Planctomycetota bacterium]|nr:MAG: hypothetical protein DWQ01_09725 [Planctomycetota bacterium]
MIGSFVRWMWSAPLILGSCAVRPDIQYEVGSKFPDGIAEVIEGRRFSPEDQAAVQEALVFSLLIPTAEGWAKAAMLNLKRTRFYLTVDKAEPKELCLALLRESGKQARALEDPWYQAKRNEFRIWIGSFESVTPSVWQVDWSCGSNNGWVRIALEENTWTVVGWGDIWLS